MKIYITFGQLHRHEINETVFDKDCVAEIECENYEQGRLIAFNEFNSKFCFSYETPPNMTFFPRGIVKLERKKR